MCERSPDAMDGRGQITVGSTDQKTRASPQDDAAVPRAQSAPLHDTRDDLKLKDKDKDTSKSPARRSSSDSRDLVSRARSRSGLSGISSALSGISVFAEGDDTSTVQTERALATIMYGRQSSQQDDGYAGILKKNSLVEESSAADDEREAAKVKKRVHFGCGIMSVFVDLKEDEEMEAPLRDASNANAASSIRKDGVKNQLLEVMDEDQLHRVLEISPTSSTQQMSNVDQAFLRSKGLPSSSPEDYPVIRDAILAAERENRRAERQLRRIEREKRRVADEIERIDRLRGKLDDASAASSVASERSEDGFFDILATVLRYTTGRSVKSNGERRKGRRGSEPGWASPPPSSGASVVSEAGSECSGPSKLLFM